MGKLPHDGHREEQHRDNACLAYKCGLYTPCTGDVMEGFMQRVTPLSGIEQKLYAKVRADFLSY